MSAGFRAWISRLSPVKQNRIPGESVWMRLKIAQVLRMMVRNTIFLGILSAMIGNKPVPARSVERPAVRVHCAGQSLPSRDMRALCRQMVQSLARVMPHAAFRQVSTTQWRPYGDQDISVRLEMSERSGKLLWQVGPMGELQTGPDRPFHALKASPATALRHFTDDLVASTHSMVAAMTATASY